MSPTAWPCRRSRRHLVAASLFLAAVACAGTRPFERPTGKHVRVLTFNVNYGRPEPGRSLAGIRAAKADVVCLQETNRGWERFLRPALRATYPHVRFRHVAAAGGQAVFSKWPVAELAHVRPRGAWFHGWFLKVDSPVGPLQILSVHLRPPADDRGRYGVAGILTTPPLRLAEIKALCKHLKPGLATVVLGDFNDGDAGLPLKWLGEQGYVNALREFDLTTPTWRWEIGRLPLAGRLDHIVHSPQLHALEARVIRTSGSDHFPLLAVLERKRPAAERPEAK